MSSAIPATAGQLRFLDDLTASERLQKLTKPEAGFLIAWLLGPPKAFSRGQQLFLFGLANKLDREQARLAIEFLLRLTEPAPELPSRPIAETPSPQAPGPEEPATELAP